MDASADGGAMTDHVRRESFGQLRAAYMNEAPSAHRDRGAA
jgi:hypothetical protein